MCRSVTLWLSVVLTVATLATCQYRQRLDDPDVVTAVDGGLLEKFLLQRARVEAVKRGILQQLGLTEAPRPPSARNRSSAASLDGDDDGRSVMAAYRRTVQQTRHRVLSNDVIGNDVVDDVTGNDVEHGDTPSARQFYSFKGHGKLYYQLPTDNSALADKEDSVRFFRSIKLIPE